MIPDLLRQDRLFGRSVAGSSIRAFTLVELLVVVAVMTVLSTLVLGGLAGAKTRTKIDRTKSTIRKLSEIIMPQYESYQRRRVPAVVTGTSGPANQFTIGVVSGTFFGPVPPNRIWPAVGVTGTSAIMRIMAQSRLQMLRTLQVFELPDSWGDIAASTSLFTSGSYPAYARTGTVHNYAAVRQSLGISGTGSNGGAECLYTIAAYGGFEPGAMENFRTDEIGDRDGNKALEFLDGWTNPITFIRWAPGISTLYSGTSPSPIQVADTVNYHDPLDPNRVDFVGSIGSGSRGYALVPLIASAGPDQTFGMTLTGSQGWSPLITSTNASGISMITVTGTVLGTVISTAVRDNITNHDLPKK